MPIYEYRCGNCGHELEAIQKISDPVLVECPSCQRQSLQRLISAPSFRLKGGGWYETDFKQDGKRNVHQPESKTDGASSGTGSGSTTGSAGKGGSAASSD
ncbi:MAG TPA: zinc ribbon domain-containing protein [Gammaproteobacteria bacterium]